MNSTFSLSRRQWLGLMSVAPFFKPARAVAADDIRTVTTACGVCSPACGIKATIKNGVVSFLEGLPGDTVGQGKLCGKGAAGAGFLYDPDRLKYPMKRTNPNKGVDEDPGWVRITWQEALDTIANRFGQALADFGAESLLFVTLPSPDVWARFMNAIGVVNRVDHIDECFLSDRIVQRYTTGGKTWGNDFENSKYILLFGWDILTKTKVPYSQGIVTARDNGARIVTFNPEYSTMGRFSDEWHPIKPGTDLAVALAIIHVLLTENLYDKPFVDKYTNFSEHEAKIRAHFEEYTPEWAERISEVPATTIRRIAREFAATPPAIVPAHKKTLCANYQNGSQLVHAISILNILAGTVDRPGGRYFPRTLAIPGSEAIYPPPAYPPKLGRRVDGKDKLPFVLEDGGGMFSTLADGILNQYPGMIKCCFFNAYTVLGFPNPPEMFRALETIPFTVVMDFLPTDTTSFADIVLPSAMYLESSDLVAREYVSKFPQVVARQALAPPIFEARGVGYVALELGKRMAPEFFQKPDGTPFTLNEMLDEQTRRAGLGQNFADFTAKGGVFTQEAPFVPRETFASRNGNGKCQIYVPDFAAKNVDALPKWRPRREALSVEYPYYYLTFIPGVHKRNSTENNRILNEMMDTNSALLNPALAAKLGVKEGQRVRIRSRAGAIELPAHLTQTLRPDCVMVAHGFGHRSRLLAAAAGKGVRDGDVIAGQTAQNLVDAGNYAGAACIMDAVVNVEPL